MAISPEDIKRWLRESKQSNRTSFGYFAEYLYAITMRKKHTVESHHSEGFDFLVDGKIKVDVKSRICLDSQSQKYHRESKSKRQSGVAYPHVVFYEKMVVIYDSESKVENVLQIPWERVSAIAVQYMKPKKRRLYMPKDSEQVEENKKVLENLAAWIKEKWKLKAKMVRRSSPSAMASMNGYGWGPEAFFLYPKDKNAGIQLVVLVYFDGETDYEFCAYPEKLWREIKWKKKTVGKNQNKRITFDPKKLDDKFKFKNIAHFKKEFLNRFSKEF